MAKPHTLSPYALYSVTASHYDQCVLSVMTLSQNSSNVRTPVRFQYRFRLLHIELLIRVTKLRRTFDVDIFNFQGFFLLIYPFNLLNRELAKLVIDPFYCVVSLCYAE